MSRPSSLMYMGFHHVKVITMNRKMKDFVFYNFVVLSLFFKTRRSMVFAKHLRLIGDDFRKTHLNSTDEVDHTVYSEDWTRMKVRFCHFIPFLMS